MTVLIDNYDSFSYNLYQMIGAMDPGIVVVRNDEVTVDDVIAMDPDRVVLSPGPGRPEDAGVCVDLVRRCRGMFPILGVCLGHQAICVAYGGRVVHADEVMHGKTSEVSLSGGSELFRGLRSGTTVGRYHSLIADPASMPAELVVTATTERGEVMAFEDADRGVFGLQFHPESVLTPMGGRIIGNFMGVRV